jgi:hypothetical protein
MIVNGVDEDRLVVTAFNGITGDIRVNPPRGLTRTSVKIADELISQWTYLCDADDNCFAVGYSKVSEESAYRQTLGHACPAPMRFGTIPTGKSFIEKLWDTADLAMRALKEERWYPDPETNGERLKGFIAGVAEAITFFASPYFRIQRDVLIEINRRWKMHDHQIPWSPTPSYRFNPPLSIYTSTDALAAAQDWADGNRPLPSPSNLGRSAKPAKQPAARGRKPAVARPEPIVSAPARTITVEDEAEMRTMRAGGIAISLIARAFDIGEGRVAMIVNPAEDNSLDLF